ncbi:hypothetical protein C7974DRAFT_306914 [Boeremia exigua]|uniref:uncharacterized protein n=1 Tax=Boeremia exigua TaxID=749465 RepID=UPI001E8E5AD0|nr:uncharacterized protein C7974DRAFT_306914 [Boeremia exigua]KAH6637808.1 hypothetical protein C7974DRAFT_306914 [Boeremia exigua]
MARRTTAVAAALLLLQLGLVAAHGGDHGGGMDMGAPTAPAPQPDTAAQSYWRLASHVPLMYWHIALEIAAWIGVLPIAVMLSIAHSRHTTLAQGVFLLLNATGLLLGTVYARQTPDLYAHNAHGRLGWAVSVAAGAWVVLGLVRRYVERKSAAFEEGGNAFGESVFGASEMAAAYQRVKEEEDTPYRFSGDSAQGTERSSASFADSRASEEEDEEVGLFLGAAQPHDDDNDQLAVLEHASLEKRAPASRLGRFFSQLKTFSQLNTFSRRSTTPLYILHVALERTLLVLGLAALLSGTVVYGGIARGPAIFNVMAHLVKGGIFLVYGLLTLGRWMGAFAEWGWAWNVAPAGRRRAPSAEFVEAGVIWVYGCTNVFLEHLAAWGGAWTAQDLEHVGISVLFFGGGLLGMIVESKAVRGLLNGSIVAPALSDPAAAPPRHYNVSMNPLPALVILLLGKMMSGHHQSSMLSATIHAQWGSMFMFFALARCLTYVVLYIAPPTSYLPSRPPTELLAAFCLVAGGVTFMVSNKDTVAALEAYGLDAMFTFTLTVGATALLLAWTTVVVAVKGWAVRVESRHARGRGVLA